MAKKLIGIVVLLLACQAWPAWAAPEDDYRAGSQAYQGGDVVQAMALLKRAADAGHAPAQALLAYILDKAEFNDEALAYYRKAAAQGNADGEYGLGTMYAAGDGVARNPVEARRWIMRAAERGHAGAINALASAYINGGLGIEDAQRNGAEALRWVRRAADSGYPPALERLAHAYRTGAYGLAVDTAQAAALEARLREVQGTAGKGAPRKKEKK